MTYPRSVACASIHCRYPYQAEKVLAVEVLLAVSNQQSSLSFPSSHTREGVSNTEDLISTSLAVSLVVILIGHT